MMQDEELAQELQNLELEAEDGQTPAWSEMTDSTVPTPPWITKTKNSRQSSRKEQPSPVVGPELPRLNLTAIPPKEARYREMVDVLCPVVKSKKGGS